MKDYIKLARPYQYTKNLFIFLPAFFATQLNEVDVIVNSWIAFLSFSFLSSSVYVFNDYVDRFEDAQHPEKSSRPIASGKIKATSAFVFMLFMFCLAVVLGFALSFKVLLLLSVYFCLNLAYTLKLKHIALIDILIIAIGFVLRLYVGSEATHVELSHWILVMTFLLALFLSLAKRRDDVLIFINTDIKMRRVIDGYNLKFLDSTMTMVASIVIVAYVMWSMSSDVALRMDSDHIYLSSFFVIVGVLRYMQITLVEEKSGNPSYVLIKDRFLQATLVGWIVFFILNFNI